MEAGNEENWRSWGRGRGRVLGSGPSDAAASGQIPLQTSLVISLEQGLRSLCPAEPCWAAFPGARLPSGDGWGIGEGDWGGGQLCKV